MSQDQCRPLNGVTPASSPPRNGRDKEQGREAQGEHLAASILYRPWPDVHNRLSSCCNRRGDFFAQSPKAWQSAMKVPTDLLSASGADVRRPTTWRRPAPAAAAKGPPLWTSAIRSCRARTATACSSSCSDTGESDLCLPTVSKSPAAAHRLVADVPRSSETVAIRALTCRAVLPQAAQLLRLLKVPDK